MLPESVMLSRMRLEYDRQRAAVRVSTPRQEPLPWGDGFLGDETPDFHGTTVGLNRHADAGEDLCPPCGAWMDELIAAGFARRLDEEPVR